MGVLLASDPCDVADAEKVHHYHLRFCPQIVRAASVVCASGEGYRLPRTHEREEAAVT